jgi:galactokinase
MQAPDLAPLRARFVEIFGAGGKGHVIRAPGRVNLIGEHTDYNDGFVFPMAIEPCVLLACRSRDDGAVRLASTAFPGEVVEFSVQAKVTRGEPSWANYSRGVAAELLGAGIPLPGMDALIDNTLPVGGGLSSSAAVEVATAQAFLTLAGLKMDPARVALLCQKAEHEFVGVPVGIMDMTAVASSRAGHAMLLDCRDLSKQFVLIDERELRVVIVNTMVRHELGAGEYAERRHQCEEGVAYFKSASSNVRALRDVSMKQLDSARRLLPEIVYRRCRHVITENARTTEAAAALGRRDYERAGELMNDSHRSLREDYEVTIPELDFLADEAQRVKGVYGSRMTGGGFGGCTVSLVQPRAVDAFVEQIRRAYEGKFRKTPDVYVTTATGGVSVLE